MSDYSGVLGDGVLGNFTLGDDPSEGGTPTTVFGQAQLDVKQTYNKFSQAQLDTLQISRVYAQSQLDINQTYSQYGQAQLDTKQTYTVFAQTQLDVLQISQGYAQGQLDLVATYQSYGQAQLSLGIIGRGFGQAQLDCLQTYQVFVQAQFDLKQTYQIYAQAQLTILGWGFGQAQLIIQGRTYAQAQVDILQIYQSFGQAQCTIILRVYVFSQAQVLICSVDTFTRTTSFGLGAGYTWQSWDSEYPSGSELLFVDGTRVHVEGTSETTYGSYSIDAGAPTRGTVQFDFLVPLAVNFALYQPFYGIHWGTSYSLDKYNLYVWGTNEAGPRFRVGDYENDVSYSFVVTPNSMYTAKMYYDGAGRALYKVWKVGDSEPDWQLEQMVPNYVSDSVVWIDLNSPIDANGFFDNLIFCPDLSTIIVRKGFGQAQLRVVYIRFKNAQAQLDVNQTYQSFGQAQLDVSPTRFGLGQAQLSSVNTYSPVAQAQVSVWDFMPHSNANLDILVTNYLVAQAQGKIKYTAIKVWAQAQLSVAIHPVCGNAQFLIDSIAHQVFSNAQMFVCWLDDFTRTTSFGLGSDYTWQSWDSSFSSPGSSSTYKVDGSKVIFTGSVSGFTSDSYSINRKVPSRGTVQFDFSIGTIGTSSHIGVVFGQDYQDNRHSLIINVLSNGAIRIDPDWSNASIPDTDITSLIQANKTYTAKESYDENGNLAYKVWETGTTEPDWLVITAIPNYVSDTNAWIDMRFRSTITGFDNLQFCKFEPFLIFRGCGQARLVVIYTQGYGQAQLSTTTTTANGMAQLYVTWTAIDRLNDTFTRTTNTQLGNSIYLWTSPSSVTHQAATTVHVNGARVEIPAGVNDSYYVGHTFGKFNYVSIDIIVNDISEAFEISLTVPGSPETEWRFGYYPSRGGSYVTFFNLNFYRNGVFVAETFLTRATGTWQLERQWPATLASSVAFDYFKIYTNGVLQGSTGSSTNIPANFGNTNLLIKITGQATHTLYLDNLMIDYAGFIFGQAQMKVKAFGVKKFGQAQLILNQAMQTGQALFVVKFSAVYAQAQLKVKRTSHGHGQAKLYIKIKRWVRAQSQLYVINGNVVGQTQCRIVRLGFNKYGQAQLLISGQQFGNALLVILSSINKCGQAQCQLGAYFAQQYGQAQLFIYPGFRDAVGQAQLRINFRKFVNAQAQIKIGGIFPRNAQAQLQVTNFNNTKCGQARLYIKRTIAHANAQLLITGAVPGNLVRFNNYYLPGYLQEEELISSMRINITGVAYGRTYNEYIGLENKFLNIRLITLGENYLEAKQQVFKAATMLRSNREDYVPLYVINPDKYYLARTEKITMEQTAGQGERKAEYKVSFEVKPWLYGNINTIEGTGLLQTIGRTVDNGTWSYAKFTLTGTDITVSGYTNTGFTGFASVSGYAENLIIDSEAYTAEINGQNRNDLMNNLDYQIRIGTGTTYFQVNGATSCIIEYRDRWPL